MPGNIKHVAFRTFYVVFTYILLFSVWWGYLLFQKNETAYAERVEILEMKFVPDSQASTFAATPEFKKLTDKYERQRLMIFLEGGVYLLLLVFGFLRVRLVFKREIELAEQQKNFLLSITHELKSPLSTVKLSLQTMQKHKLEQEKQDKLIYNSLADLDRLHALVDNILFAAKIERDQHGMHGENIDVSALTKVIAERYAGNKKRISIKTQLKEDVVLNADSIGYTSMVVNLIENAIKYSPEDTTITVELSVDDSNAVLQVKDEGIGIPPSEKDRVFEKFYRVGSENTRNTKGTGLGLYIVKRFVEIHKGKISIEPNQPQGTVVKVLLPV